MRYLKLIMIAGVVLIAVTFAARAFADERCENSIRVDMAVTAKFVTIPDAPPMTAKGSGEVCYELGEKSATIVGESIPELLYTAIDPPLDLPHLAVIAEVIPGTTPHLSWKEPPKVDLTGVDVRVRAYAMKFAAVSEGSDAVVDIVLSNLSFTTGRIEVEGASSEGYIDPEQLRAVLVGKAILPDHSFPPYDEWLAGQPVLLELMVRMKNPYSK